MMETFFYILIQTFPTHLFAYIPFWDHLRFSKRLTFLLLLAEQSVFMGLFVLLVVFGVPIDTAQWTAIPFYGPLFFYFVKMEWGKILFLYLFSTDYLMVLTSFTRFLGQTFFRLSPYSWQSSLIMLLLFAVTLPIMLRYFCKTAQSIFAIHAPKIWKTVWLLPLLINVIVMLLIFPINSTDWRVLLARVLMMACICLLYFYTTQILRHSQQQAAIREQARNLQHFIQMQADQYALLQTRIEETRRSRHDLHQHWTTLQAYLDQNDLEALKSYVKKYSDTLTHDSLHTFCPNFPVNAILCFYDEQAKNKGINMEISFRTAPETAIPEPEFCVLLSNLLENAMESCERSEQPAFIRVNAVESAQKMLTLTVDNTCTIPPKIMQNRLLSTKHDGFGIGTESIRVIAEKYQGDTRFQWENGIFYASVMIFG